MYDSKALLSLPGFGCATSAVQLLCSLLVLNVPPADYVQHSPVSAWLHAVLPT